MNLQPTLGQQAAYDDIRLRFRWAVPERFNIATVACDQWAKVDPARTAIVDVGPDFAVSEFSYGALRLAADTLASAFQRAGIQPGERIAIFLPQGRHVAVAHMAIYKLGAIAVPLAVLFGPEAITYRLQDSGARLIITDQVGAERLAPLMTDTPRVETILSMDGEARGAMPLARFTEGAAERFETRDSCADDPALMIYTSGTTGHPKGALHGHRVLLGHLPGVEMHHDFLPQKGDRLWTPGDWAWAGGSLNVLLPGLTYGVPVVAWAFQKFDPEAA
ncbi:MAG: AMP-binding protein, partial [Rhabdaerophilum sp.]